MTACGVIVSGTPTLLATATSDIGVAAVQFKLDGANLGPKYTAAPYSMAWNTTTVSNGCHTLSAVARHTVGNQGVPAPLLVTVSNP